MNPLEDGFCVIIGAPPPICGMLGPPNPGPGAKPGRIWFTLKFISANDIENRDIVTYSAGKEASSSAALQGSAFVCGPYLGSYHSSALAG